MVNCWKIICADCEWDRDVHGHRFLLALYGSNRQYSKARKANKNIRIENV